MRIPALLTIILTASTLLGATAAETGATPGHNGGANAAEERGEGKHESGKLHRAAKELEEAIETLKQAPHDFGGHKKAAIEACEKALAELHAAAEFDQHHEHGKGEGKKGDK